MSTTWIHDCPDTSIKNIQLGSWLGPGSTKYSPIYPNIRLAIVLATCHGCSGAVVALKDAHEFQWQSSRHRHLYTGKLCAQCSAIARSRLQERKIDELIGTSIEYYCQYTIYPDPLGMPKCTFSSNALCRTGGYLICIYASLSNTVGRSW